MPFYIFVVIVLAGVDQVLKFQVRELMSPTSYIEIIPNFIHLMHQENRGISFSLLSDLPTVLRVPLLAGISIIVVIGICYYVYRNWEPMVTAEKWGFALIIAGAIGNLIDRAIRQQVTDYMYFHFYDTGFFVNNFADDLISIGFVLILFVSFKKKNEET